MSGRHVVIFIIIIIVVRRLRRRLQREPVPCLPPTVLLQGFPSSHPLTSSGLFCVLLLLFLLRSEPTCGSVCHVLQDRWKGEFKTPQPLGTNKNPNSKNQRRRKLGAKQKEDQTLTKDTYPRLGRIAGWLRAPASSLPTVPATRLRRSSAEREVEDIRELSKSTPGSISESRNRRSAKGSTLRRWIVATTPAAVRPSSHNFCKACRIGWSFSWFSRVAPQRQLLPAVVTTR
jgi:hypothetical protein